VRRCRDRPRNAWRTALAVAAAGALAGCGAVETLDYYWQGATGQMDLIARARPIDDVIAEGGDAALAARLARVQEIRAFASRDLALPDNASYTRYTELGRPFVLWNVFATPELSLTPRQWCFPVAGCVNYRGYFRESEARAEAARIAARDDDVYVSGVPAYSTLGWFDDPVLSSFVGWPETEVARLVFHELAHQVVYVKDDTQFNESFATAVEEAGIARWLAARRDPALDAQAARAQRLRAAFRDIVQDARASLAAIYAAPTSDDGKRAAKAATFAAMQAAYERSKAGEPGLAGYDRWFAQRPNNASLAAISLYTDRVDSFRALLADTGGDLPRFYARVRELAALPKAERDAALLAAASRVPEAAGGGGESSVHDVRALRQRRPSASPSVAP
jgi:predicted aminopeptidase